MKPRMKPAYSRIQTRPNADEYLDIQFEKRSKKFPLKSIVFASFLFVFGSILILFSIYNLIGDISMDNFNRYTALLILGLIMFIPGFYHVSIACLAFKQYPGYSFDDIIDFD